MAFGLTTGPSSHDWRTAFGARIDQSHPGDGAIANRKYKNHARPPRRESARSIQACARGSASCLSGTARDQIDHGVA